MTTFLDTDLESQEAMDELDEEEMTPRDDSVSTILSDLNSSEDWFYTVDEEQDPVDEEQDPVDEEQDLVGGISFAQKREMLCEYFSQRLKDGS